MTNKKAVFCRLGSRPIPRVLRMMNVARSAGFEAVFLSARREADLPSEEVIAGHTVRRIGRFFPLVNGSSFFTYLGGVVSYNIASFRALRRHQPGVVHCSDIETMPAVIIHRLFFRIRLIYNIHDNLSERYNLPGWARAILNVIEGVVVLSATVALVPEGFRRESLPRWCRKKVQIVRNTPEDKGRAAPLRENRPIRIFFGGWLDAGRGLHEMLALVRQEPDFFLTIAGEGDPAIISKITSNPRTEYLGFVGHDEIMSETAHSHFVAALYSPHRPINRHAASNKLAEALSLGRPVLVNSEMLIIRDLADYDCLISMPYADILGHAADKLRDLLAASPADTGGQNTVYQQKSDAARRAYEALYDWNTAETAMRAALLGTTGQKGNLNNA